MPTNGYDYHVENAVVGVLGVLVDRLAVGRGKGRGVTKPPLRRKRRRR